MALAAADEVSLSPEESKRQTEIVEKVGKWLAATTDTLSGVRLLSQDKYLTRLEPMETVFQECVKPASPLTSQFDKKYAVVWDEMKHIHALLREVGDILDLEFQHKTPSRPFGTVAAEILKYRTWVAAFYAGFNVQIEKAKLIEHLLEKVDSGDFSALREAIANAAPENKETLRERYLNWLRKQGDEAAQGKIISNAVIMSDLTIVVTALGQIVIKVLEAATNKGHGDSAYCLSVAYLYGIGVDKNEVKGIELVRSAANTQVVLAQLGLGVAYLNGLYGLAMDREQGLKWIKAAADQNSTDAQIILGRALRDGKLTPQDGKAALVWFLRAANAGDPEGMFYVALMYQDGKLIDRNFTEAFTWARKGAELGHGYCQLIYGTLYANGSGVERNDELALRWITKSAERGNKEAQKLLPIVRDRLAQGQAAAQGSVIPSGTVNVGLPGPSTPYPNWRGAWKTCLVCGGTGIDEEARRENTQRASVYASEIVGAGFRTYKNALTYCSRCGGTGQIPD
ncbi:MAG: hypothetical protein NTX56_08190 [Proteobacteria bacterium]|nr:hypothetical protein [Pseudomonadota bacterium]